MVYKSLRMIASASPELPATPRECKRSVKPELPDTPREFKRRVKPELPDTPSEFKRRDKPDLRDTPREFKRRVKPELPDTPREFKRREKSLTELEVLEPEKYIHVHHFKNTKLYGAWFNDPSRSGKKVRLFFGSHLTAYLAARAQDRAALKYKPHALDPRSIKLNFKEEDYVADQKLREMLTCEEFGELLRKESRPKYTKMEPTRCLRKFLEHERARGNIPSAVPPQEENLISLRQYLQEVIRKRDRPDEDMEDPVPVAEESREDPESIDEDMEDPGPTAKRKKHALKEEERKKRKLVFIKPRNPRPPVAGPSESKPLVPGLPPLVWGRTRPRTKQHEVHVMNKLEYKLHKINSTMKYLEPAPPIKPEGLPTEVKNKKNPKPGNEGLPHSPELQLRIKWHPKTHKKQKLQTSRNRAEILPAEAAKTKTAEPRTGGLIPQTPEFPKSQFRSKWHYKLHEIQKSQASRTSEPSPPKAVEGSCLQTRARTGRSKAKLEKLA